jgi:Ni,Fe-hydrogenase III small subunit
MPAWRKHPKKDIVMASGLCFGRRNIFHDGTTDFPY